MVFAAGLNRNRGLDVFQVHDVFLLLWAVGKNLGRHLCQLCAKRQQQQGGGDVEDGVGVGNLRRNGLGVRLSISETNGVAMQMMVKTMRYR